MRKSTYPPLTPEASADCSVELVRTTIPMNRERMAQRPTSAHGLPQIAMPQKPPLIVRPAALSYDQGESLPGGAQFMKFNRVRDLEAYWAVSKGERPYACCGTGATEPALFLHRHEWIFAPTKEALVAAVTRWEEFGILPRWYDLFSEEWEAHDEIDAKRLASRHRRVMNQQWSAKDESAFNERTEKLGASASAGYWRITRLPCNLSHFDWFSEQANLPIDPDLEIDAVSMAMKRGTFDDWKLHQTQDGVQFLVGGEVDDDIAYWQSEDSFPTGRR